MGSKSKSSKQQNTSYNTETLNTNIEGNDGFAIAGINKSSIKANVEVTDKEAIAQAFTFAENVSERALDFAFEAGRPEAAISEKQLYVGGAVVAAGIGAYIYSKEAG